MLVDVRLPSLANHRPSKLAADQFRTNSIDQLNTAMSGPDVNPKQKTDLLSMVKRVSGQPN